MQPQIQLQAKQTQQTVPPIAPIDPQPIIEHGTEPGSLILAIAILISVLLGSITGLVQVILHSVRSHRSEP